MLLDAFTVHDPALSKTAAIVLNGAQPLPSDEPPGVHATALVTRPFRRTAESDAARLLADTVQTRTGLRPPIIHLGDIDAEAYRALDLVHVGVNPRVRALLRPIWSAVREELRSRADATTDDFAPEFAPDGDGFLVVALRDVEGPRQHLVLLGGVGFGTYFAVAALLARHAEARWLWPGPTGTVIPRAPTLVLSGVAGDSALNLYDEPDYRGRGLDLLAALSQSFAAIDATRTWALNNGLHPADPRIYLWQKVRARREAMSGSVLSEGCRPPVDESERLLARKEARIPVPHALNDMLSPTDPVPGGGVRGGVFPALYPDIRPRVSLDGNVLVPGASDPSPLGLPARLGRPVRAAQLRASPGDLPAVDGCVDPYEPWPPSVRATGLSSLTVTNDSTPRIGPEDLGALTDPRVGAAPYSPSKLGPALEPFTAIVDAPARDLYRFVPYTSRSTAQQLHQPAAQGWKPCVYDDTAEPRGRPGRLAPLRQALIDQVTVACLGQSSAMSALPSREVVLSLLPNDSGGWCQCDACILSASSNGDRVGGRIRVNAAAGQPASWRMYKGVTLFAIEQSRPDLPRTVQIEGQGPVPNFAFYDGDLGVTEPWVVPEALRAEFATPTLTQDQLVVLGMLTNGRQLDDHSRRHVDLVRAVAQGVNAMLPPGTEEVWFTTAAYSTWRAAPMFQGSTEYLFDREVAGLAIEGVVRPGDAQETALPANVIVFITGVRDLKEYDPRRPWYRGSSAIRAWSRASEQFNVTRWGVIARVLGAYEYMLDGGMYVCARLYTHRLHTALWRMWREGGRAFEAEARPAWAMDGPKWFELAGSLWSVGDVDDWRAASARPAALRREFCRALATPTEGTSSASPDPGFAADLVHFFDAVEADWSLTVDLALDGYQGSWELGLTNRMGRIAQFGVTDPLGLLSNFDVPNARVTTLEGLVQRSPSASVRLRMDFVRKGWRLFDFFARITREARYLRQYVHVVREGTRRADGMPGLAFINTWADAPTIPVPSEALLTGALTRLSAWLADPMVFRREVREGLNARLAELGVLRIVGAQVEAPSGSDDALTDDQFALDLRSLSAYLGSWNARTERSFDLFNEMGIDATSGVYGALIADLKRTVSEVADAVRNFVPSQSPAELAAVGRASQTSPSWGPQFVDNYRQGA